MTSPGASAHHISIEIWPSEINTWRWSVCIDHGQRYGKSEVSYEDAWDAAEKAVKELTRGAI